MRALRVVVNNWLYCAICLSSICMILPKLANSTPNRDSYTAYTFPFTSFSSYDAVVSPPSIIFYADFEDTFGDNVWSINNGASDGNWVIGQPTPYITGGTQMEIASYAGNQNLQTGTNSSQDLDGGPAIAESRVITLDPNADDIDISFHYYFSHYSNSSADDNLIVQLIDDSDDSDDSVLATLVNETGTTASRPAQWTSVQQDISTLAGKQVYIKVSGQDISNGSKVEGAIDEIEITQNISNPTGLTCNNLITDGFESGYGNWNDGGSDCARVNNTAYSNTGTFSARLRDNSSTSVLTSDPYDLSTVDEVTVSFSYLAESMENGEDFWFQISTNGGSSFTTLYTWVSGSDFANGTREFEDLSLTAPFSNNTVFRFRCDASNNSDYIYLDDIVIDTCITAQLACFDVNLPDTVLCNDMTLSLSAEISNLTGNLVSHQWTVLPTTTSTGYTLSGSNTSTLFVDPIGGLPGTIDLLYTVSDDGGCTEEVETTVFVLGVEPCIIRVESDTICLSTTATLNATTLYQITPDSGAVISANSGDGNTETHEIIGVQDPLGVKVTITLPTWDDHFAETILNGNTILPEILEPDSWGPGGMDIVNPWNPNVNGLPRSIITIENNEVHYYISQTVNSTAMQEVFPTNWVTTPQNFVPGNNTLVFGIENTVGPISGSWYIEAEGISGYKYLWTTGDTTNTLDVTPTETTTYGVTVTAPNGCSYSCDKTIYVNDLYADVADVSLCVADQFTTNATITPNISAPYQHQWSLINDGNTNISLQNTTSEYLTIDSDNASAGTATIEYSIIDKFGCTALDTFTVEVINSAQLTCISKVNDEPWTAGDCSIETCHGSTITFDVNNSSSSNISWIGPNEFTSNNELINLENLSAQDAGIYTAYYSAGSCYDSLKFDISVLEDYNTVFYADFENTTGDNDWTITGVGGTGDGDWTIGIPSPYSTNGYSLEIPAYEGTQSLLTGNGINEDLDGGPTVAQSIDIVLPDSAQLDLQYYYAYYTNGSSADYFYLLLRDSADDSVLDTLINLNASTAGMIAEWKSISRDLSAYTGETVYLEAITADLSNQSKIEVALDQILIKSGNQCSCTEAVYENISYQGCDADGYTTTINGVVYDANNPTGTELLSTYDGCDSIVTINLEFFPRYTGDTRSYTGCEGDGYSIVVNGVNYNESNPTGTEIMQSQYGCDSIVAINLIFNPVVIVEAGMPQGPACSNGPIDLSTLGANISGGTTQGQWTTMGTGYFDNGGMYGTGANSATIYTMSEADIASGEVILTLTSIDPAGPCEPEADAVMIKISDITCSQFPWAGN